MIEVETYLQDKSYFQSGYIGAAGFTALMGLGAGPRMMQGILLGAGALAAGNIFLNKADDKSSTTTLAEGGMLAYAIGKILWGFKAARKEINSHLNQGAIKLIQNSSKLDYSDVAPTGTARAQYISYYHKLIVPKALRGTHTEVHERIHASCRDWRVHRFGARAQVNRQSYYNVSNLFKKRFHLSWFKASVEAFVDTVTLLKTPSVKKNILSGTLERLCRIAVWTNYAVILAFPLAFLMDHAWDGAKKLLRNS